MSRRNPVTTAVVVVIPTATIATNTATHSTDNVILLPPGLGGVPQAERQSASPNLTRATGFWRCTLSLILHC